MIVSLEITETACRLVVDTYLADTFGAEYHSGRSQLRNGYWRFMILYQPNDTPRPIAVGGISVDAVSGKVRKPDDEQIRNMCEAGAVQVAQVCKGFARDECGHILRRQARIKANCWISDRIGLKVRDEGGVLIPLDSPIWRFSICYHGVGPLALLDVNANNGQIEPLTDKQLQAIQEDVSAIRQFHLLATTARG